MTSFVRGSKRPPAGSPSSSASDSASSSAGPTPSPGGRVVNFGGNIRFQPRRRYAPRTEDDVLRILRRHRRGTIRVVGARHSWNPGIETPDVLVDLRRIRRVRVHDDRRRVTVGAGCRIGALLRHLGRRGLTLPSIGLIDRQTVAGAVATGTHGSGRHSMSHYVEATRIACYGGDGRPQVRTVDAGAALRAARCSVGAMGIVLDVTLRCVPQYHVRERCVWRDGLDAVLSGEETAPLQQFYILPHAWTYLVHERSVAAENRRSGLAALYRAYWLIVIDVALHLGVKLTASWLRSRRLARVLYERILPAFIFPGWRVTDRSDRQLLMRHDLFRHLEMEVFVPRDRLREALDLVTEVLRAADDAAHAPSVGVRETIEALGEGEVLERIRGSWSPHYPVCVRRLRPDDTLISMASRHGIGEGDWYAISLITLAEPRTDFQEVARLLAVVMTARFGARLHWGKWFPLDGSRVEGVYPGLEAFRAVCDEHDPDGVFRNAFVTKVLFGFEASASDESGR